MIKPVQTRSGQAFMVGRDQSLIYCTGTSTYFPFPPSLLQRKFTVGQITSSTESRLFNCSGSNVPLYLKRPASWSFSTICTSKYPSSVLITSLMRVSWNESLFSFQAMKLGSSIGSCFNVWADCSTPLLPLESTSRCALLLSEKATLPLTTATSTSTGL